MKEVFEKDDELRALIREEGLLSPSPDFTLRVMHLIGENEKLTRHEFKPLLSTKAWTLIISAVVVLVFFCWWMLTKNQGNGQPFLEVLKPVTDFVNLLDLSLHFNSRVLLIGTFIVSSLGVFLSIDIWMSYKNPKFLA